MPSNMLTESDSTSKLSKSMPLPTATSRKFILFRNHQKKAKPKKADVFSSLQYDQGLIKHLRLKVTIVQVRQIASDIDAFFIVRCLKYNHRTHVIKGSTEPNWSCSFNIPVDSITKRKQWRQGITITLCSKDKFRSQFLGQIHLPFPAAEQEAALLYDDIHNNSNWHPIHSKQSQGKLSLSNTPRRRAFSESLGGEINVKTGLILEGFEGDHLQAKNHRIKHVWKMLTSHKDYQRKNMINSAPTTPQFRSTSSSLPPEIGNYMPKSSSCSTNTPTDYFDKQTTHLRRVSADGFQSSTTTSSPQSPSGANPRKRLTRTKKKLGIEGKFHQDVFGVTFLEVCSAKDLPPERNLARTSFDMDPFVVVSYGTSTFRTSAVRHNLNPVWNEKLFFHVRHHEANYHLKFTVYDREKFSGNDLVAWCQVPIQKIIGQHKKMQFAGQEEEEVDMIEKEMDRHTFPLQMVNPEKWKNKRPTLTIRAKFMPYEEIRKMFWLSLAKVYDAEHTDTLSRLEVQSMLETIGSTITEATIDKFWSNNGKDPKDPDQKITLDQLVDSLENYMKAEADYNAGRPMYSSTGGEDVDKFNTNIMRMASNDGNINDEGDDDEEADDIDEDDENDEDWNGIEREEDEDDELTENLLITSDDDEQLPFDMLGREMFDYSSPSVPAMQQEEVDLAEALIEEENSKLKQLPATPNCITANQNNPAHRHQTIEKVVCLKECPICHRPNLGRRSQMDIITHIATCAANDWTTVDRFLMGNFLTEAYAQRRWFVKLVRKVGYGKYSLGKDNANIIIQDRRTGQLIEEKMSVYVRLGMRLVYKGMKTSIQSKGAQRILTNLTLKQGRRFDSPNSAREIPGFIKFHKIQLHEVWKPVSSFKTFNEFFYRKLRPGSRPADSPEDSTVAVSPADSRMTAFDSVSEATRLWIKGIEFSLEKLLGDSSSAIEFQGGPLAVFRLAPQDYHRFHSPVDGIITKIKHISGQYYTVNPMAIRTTIDVFGENARTIVWMDSKDFGKVAVVCVGAMLVGSIIITAKVGSEVKRTDEMGYFAFGGSTLVVVFENGKMNFDHDLLENSDRTVETLVQVGNHIGKLPLQ